MIKFEVSGQSSLRKKFTQAIIPSICSQLKIEKHNFNLLVSFHRDLQHDGCTVLINDSQLFFIAIKPFRDLTKIGISLCHEMVHVSQMAKGILRNVPGGYTWKNHYFSDSSNYLDRPWEIQAYEKQELLFRRAVTI